MGLRWLSFSGLLGVLVWYGYYLVWMFWAGLYFAFLVIVDVVCLLVFGGAGVLVCV